MNYKTNRQVLEKIIENREIIRPIATRNADDTIELESNLKMWNSVISQFSQIQLWSEGAPNYDENIVLQPQPSIVFVPTPLDEVRGTIIVAHGGGFIGRTGCEGVHTAHYFNKAGFNVAILTYRIKPYTRIDAINDMQRAIRVLRSKTEELNISDKIAVMGFSAGGMLSGNCATHFDNGNNDAADSVERYSSRPDAAVIAYGAFNNIVFPTGVFENPFDDSQRAEKIYLSPDKNISVDTPPFFIWTTNSDDPRHSLNLAKELTDYGVPFELHCFPDGPHGVALADGNNDLDYADSHLNHWSELCNEWLKEVGI